MDQKRRMTVVYTGEQAPESFNKSLFLAGPTPRSKDVQSWRPEALKILEEKGYDGVVFMPEDREGNSRLELHDQYSWEHECINMSDCVMFWVPRDLQTLPAFTTNIEFGWLVHSGKMIFGAPETAEKVDYMHYFADKVGVPNLKTLEETIARSLSFLGGGSYRDSGARQVPLFIWLTPSFQSWYQAQRRAGNTLEGAKVECTIRYGSQKERVYLWVVHANVFIWSENRNKTNEVVLSRPDISSVVLYKKADDLLKSSIVLVREFRTPVSNSECFVLENAGGSAMQVADPKRIASDEVFEETGLRIDPIRISYHSSRQLMATFSAHKVNTFSAELTDSELESLKMQLGVPHGDGKEDMNGTGERTYVEIHILEDILKNDSVDWSTIGMIMAILQGAGD